MPYPVTRDGIRRRFKDAGMKAVPSDDECDALIRLTEMRSQAAGRPVDVVGHVIRKLRSDVARMRMQRRIVRKENK